MPDLATPTAPIPGKWRRSSYSGPEGGSCVEVMDGHSSAVPVRDSKKPRGAVLTFTPASWTAFIATARVEPTP
ncbi:DUF397 domain-containing protein [Streptomyces alkaliphilus]|uniref:DUF397 domain-containing protein n=1 Tax=Streptomyces alkaliphilus TaxID=1472722 RepID=A0A7W3TEP4_9ACTN|nr:DUF397 domain-containing protein [Streptomyces alkaliphilus]MBB0245285.1 DUF397 domain-containing protein [Streptomyces alkaliphilus]